MFSLIWAWTNGWANNRDAGGLRRHRTHSDVTVMTNLGATNGDTAGIMISLDFQATNMHQMMTSSNGTLSASLVICAGNSPVAGEFPAQRPVTRSFEVLFDLHPNKLLSKQSWAWWFETPPCSLWRHCNETFVIITIKALLHSLNGTSYVFLCPIIFVAQMTSGGSAFRQEGVRFESSPEVIRRLQ